MEKLLNVRQAAELLNVSEMAVRRWTNAGLPACFRIGKKRERRFHPSDIQQFLEGKTPSPGTEKKAPGIPARHVALGFGGLDVAELIRENRLIQCSCISPGQVPAHRRHVLDRTQKMV